MKKILLLLSFILLIGTSRVSAQTVSQTLEYDFLATSPAVVGTYTQSLKINTGANTLITPPCVAQGTGTHCAFPLTTPVKSGDVLVITVTGTNGLSSTGGLTYLPGAPPTSPTTITITITIKVP